MDESQDREREVQRAQSELDHQAGEMEQQTDELGSDIDQARQEFQRKRSDAKVPGLPPDPGSRDGQESEGEGSPDVETD